MSALREISSGAKRHVALALPVGLLAAAVAVAMLGPQLAELLGLADPAATVAPPFAAPGAGLPLGSDGLGRDVMARLLHGGTSIIVVSVLAVLCAEVVGSVVGIALASSESPSRTVGFAFDAVLVLPPILVLLVVVTAVGTAPLALIALVTVISVPFVARYVAAAARPVVSSGYVEVAVAAGDRRPTVIVREVLPNLVAPLLADAGARFVAAVYMVSTAGFLGASTGASDGNWAAMVQQNLEGITLNIWSVLAPALAVAAITVPANVLADRLSAGAR